MNRLYELWFPGASAWETNVGALPNLTHMLRTVGRPWFPASLLLPPEHDLRPDYTALIAFLRARFANAPSFEEFGLDGPECSFCERPEEETLLLYRTAMEGSQGSTTICGDCLIVACVLLERLGELPKVVVGFLK